MYAQPRGARPLILQKPWGTDNENSYYRVVHQGREQGQHESDVRSGLLSLLVIAILPR